MLIGTLITVYRERRIQKSAAALFIIRLPVNRPPPPFYFMTETIQIWGSDDFKTGFRLVEANTDHGINWIDSFLD